MSWSSLLDRKKSAKAKEEKLGKCHQIHLREVKREREREREREKILLIPVESRRFSIFLLILNTTKR